MSASRRPAPLDPETLRAQVAANKLVRVAVAPSAQFPDGTVGRVRRVGDPAVDGDEFVFVEVSMDGTKDVVPFALTDLGPTGARSKTPPTTAAKPPKPEPIAPQTRPLPRASVSGPPPTVASSAGPASAATTGGSGATVTLLRPTGSRPAARGTAKPARRPSPPVTVTLVSTDEPGQWRVDAKVGTKAVVKAVAVPAARLWDMVQLLDSPPLADAVRSHLDEQRRVAAERAERLRAELSAVQAELDALPGAD